MTSSHPSSFFRHVSNITLIVLVFSTFVFSKSAFAQNPQDSGYLLGVSEVLKAQGEYQYQIANARLQEARAALTMAQANHQIALTEQLTQFTKRLKLELIHLKKEEHKKRKQISSLEKHIKRVQIIKTGKTSHSILSSLNMILRFVPGRIIIDALRKKIPLDDKENSLITKDMFIANKKGKRIKVFQGKYLGDLIRFITKNNYSLEPFSEAHFAVLDALDEFDSFATQKAQDIRDYLLELRDGTLNIWSPPGLERLQLPGGSSNSFGSGIIN